MGKREKIVVLRDGLESTPPFRAWRQLVPRSRRPTSIEILKPEKRKSAVYRLRGVEPSGSAVIVKRRQEGHPQLEMEHRLYAELLPTLPVATLGLLGFVEAHDGFSWLFLEDAGEDWYSTGIKAHRELAVEWLAKLHTADASPLSWLPRRGPQFQLSVLRMAENEVRESLGHPALTPENIETLRRILGWLCKVEERWDELEAVCAVAPGSLVHGDFVPKNVRVRIRRGRPELVAFDWETAGWALPATDLGLIPLERAALRAYRARVREAGWRVDWSDVLRLRAVGDLFRLINCVHWGSRTFRHDWIDRGMRDMEVYELRLGAAVTQDLSSGGTT